MKKASRWSCEDDVLLKKTFLQILQKSGNLETFEEICTLPNNFGWVEVSKKMYHRNSKQCRERFHNHVRPGINPLPWTSIEDTVLIFLAEKYPSQWTQSYQSF